MIKEKAGFITLIVFMILSAATIIGLIGLVHARRCYHVAQMQYRYYQQKYQLEGLLNFAISMAHNEFKAVHKKEKPQSITIKNWCSINNETYDGIVSIAPAGENVFAVKLTLLHSGVCERKASCNLIREKNVLSVHEWKI